MREEAMAAVLRARDGYDKSAVWDFWTWHAKMCVKILTEYRDTCNGTPPNPDALDDDFGPDSFYTPEAWSAKITEVIDAFQNILDLDESGEDIPQTVVDDAFDKLSAIYLSLWD